MTKPKISQTEYNELCKTLKNTYDIIPDEIAASDEAYMNIENKKRTATLRKDGRYMAPYTDAKGNRKFKYGRTKEEALQNAIEAEKTIYDQKISSKFSFESCYNAWFLMKCGQAKKGALKYSTLDRIERAYNKYFKGTDFAASDVRQWTERTIVDFLQETIEEEHGFTRKNWTKIFQIVHSSLVYMYDVYKLERKSFVSFEWETIKRYIEENCIVNRKNTKAKLMTEAEKTKFNQAINQNSDPKKVPASKAALANEKIGLRRGELIALKWKNVDFENETVNIDHGECQYFQRDENGKRTGTTLYEISDPKTEKSKRCIPLTKETIKILQEIKDEQMENGWYSDDQFVIYNGVDYKSRANHYSYIMKYMCREADIRNIPNHLLRKTFATNLSTSGVAENVIIDILGHTSYQTTSDYYILDTEIKDKRSQIQKAEDAKAI